MAKLANGDETQETRRKVTTVRVTCNCPEPGCTGNLVSTGSSFTQWDTAFEHKCSECGVCLSVINRRYPYIDYVEFS